MNIPSLLFLILYWPCIRLAQVMHRLAQGKQLGDVRDTMISAAFLGDIPYWLIYLGIIIWRL